MNIQALERLAKKIVEDFKRDSKLRICAILPTQTEAQRVFEFVMRDLLVWSSGPLSVVASSGDYLWLKIAGLGPDTSHSLTCRETYGPLLGHRFDLVYGNRFDSDNWWTTSVLSRLCKDGSVIPITDLEEPTREEVWTFAADTTQGGCEIVLNEGFVARHPNGPSQYLPAGTKLIAVKKEKA